MESMLILLIILAVLLNIKAGLAIWHYKQKDRELNADKEVIQQSMSDFVGDVERENEELYAKLVAHINAKESNFENRIRLLEEESANGTDSQESDGNQLVGIEPGEQPESLQFPMDQPIGEKIEQLFKQGFSVNQIAKVLQVDRGAVELTVNLLEKKKIYQK